MKKIAVFIIALLIVVFFSKTVLNNSNQIKDESATIIDNREVNEIEEEGSSGIRYLEGENVFNPRETRAGDRIMGLQLKEFRIWESTNTEYPYDDFIATFEGEIVLTGTALFIEPGIFYNEAMLFFQPDEASSKLLPVAYYKKPNEPMVFDNKDEAISLLKIKPGEKLEDIQIIIENYTVVYFPTDALNSAIFLHIMSH